MLTFSDQFSLHYDSVIHELSIDSHLETTAMVGRNVKISWKALSYLVTSFVGLLTNIIPDFRNIGRHSQKDCQTIDLQARSRFPR